MVLGIGSCSGLGSVFRVGEFEMMGGRASSLAKIKRNPDAKPAHGQKAACVVSSIGRDATPPRAIDRSIDRRGTSEKARPP
jgi:hypothetical protein